MVAVVSGVGPGLGASLCRRLLEQGTAVAAIARSAVFGAQFQTQLDADSPEFRHYRCDVRNEKSVNETIASIRNDLGPITTLIHNAGVVTISPFLDTDTATFQRLWEINCLGAVNTARAVLPDMLDRNAGTLLFTGATAALRGSANFSAFAASKFALRGLVQSLAREYGPHGIHVAHIIIDGLIWGAATTERFAPERERCLDPDQIALQYVTLINQDRSAWTQELDLRPYTESF